MSDGKCPDLYECRMGIDKILRENLLLRAKIKRLNRKGITLAKEEQTQIGRLMYTVILYEESFIDAAAHCTDESNMEAKAVAETHIRLAKSWRRRFKVK